MRFAIVLTVFAASAVHAAPALPSLYAPMFAKGRAFTYDVDTTDFDLDPTGNKLVPMPPKTAPLACRVDEVVTFKKLVASKFVCDRDIDPIRDFRVDGLWVATKDGLARLDNVDLPTTEADASIGQLVIAASPKARNRTTKTQFGGVMIDKIAHTSDGWCTTNDTTHYGAGDGAIITMCFQSGTGLFSGRNDYQGGTPRIVGFRLHVPKKS